MKINKQDTNGVKPLLQVGELGYDNYPGGGDAGRVFVGTGSENIALGKKTEIIAVDTKADTHIARVDNPHGVTKTQVGLGNVDNTSDANKPISTATQTALDGKQATLVSGTNIKTVAGQSVVGSGNVAISKSDVGLGNVPNVDVYSKTEVQTVLPKVGLDTTNVTTPGVGQLAWNGTEDTVDIGLNGAVLQVGQETLIRVRNTTGSTLTNGSVVMSTGTIGNSGRITVANANVSSDNARYVLGILTEDIAAGADGFVTTFGKVRGINTTGSQYGETWADGDVLYVKDTGNGALTKVVPLDTQMKMPIAIVINAHATNGTLFIRVTGIDENHAKGDILSVNLLRADKFLAAQNIANMIYTSGDLTKIRYNNDTDVNYEVLNYTSGNLSTINHYVGGVLKGTTTLSYSSGNLVSAVFA